MADITSFSELKLHLEREIQNSPAPELTPTNGGVDRLVHFLTEVPGRSIPLSNVSVDIITEKNQLILSGDTDTFWGICSWGGEGVTIQAIEIKFTEVSGKILFDFKLDGSIEVGGKTILLKGHMREDDSLRFRLPDNLNEKISLTQIANLISHNKLGPYLPDSINLFDNVPLSELDITIGFFSSSVDSSRFTSDIGVNWEIVGDKVQLKTVGITLESTAQFNRAGHLEETIGGNIHATLELGKEFDVRLRLQGQYRWIIEIIPKDGNILPGLSSLAGLIGGTSFQQKTRIGLESFGINALSVDYAGIGVDIYQKKLQNVTIKGHLTFYDHTFFIETHLPNFELYGGLSPTTPIHLKALVKKFFSGGDVFPEVDITEFNISIQPKLDSYSLFIGIHTNWKLNLGEVGIDIKQFSFQINKHKKAITGGMEGKFNFLGAEFDLLAEHPAAGSGWNFDGHTIPGEPNELGKFITDIGDHFGTGNSLPASLTNLKIEQLQVSFNTATKDFRFLVDTKFPIDQKELDAVIDIEITHNDGKYSRKFSGIVKVGDLEFDLIFNQEKDTGAIFLAAYENKAGKDQSIESLVRLITEDTAIIEVSKGISFNLKDALLVVDKGDETKILFGLDIGGGLDVSKLPLVGKMFPAKSTVRMTFQPLLTNKDFEKTELDKVRPLVPAGGFQLPEEAKDRLGFSMQLMIGNEPIDLSLSIVAGDVKDQTPEPNAPPMVPAAGTTSSPPVNTANIKWFVIQKKLGPVHFGRVGIQFQAQEQKLYFLLDASLSLAGLTISLDGLFVSSMLKPIHPKFGLHGLGLDYKKGPLEIGGAFLRQTLTDPQGNSYDSYDGTAIIRTEKFALAALGSYAFYQGHPSLFIYAFLDVPLGGPSFFFVTGLAAGFGYNRRIVVPGIDEVSTFPLVAEAMSGVPGTTNDLSEEINKLHEVIPPAVGEYFLAVGIRFSSFEIIDSFVLLTISFGEEFEVDVLGLSTLVIPTPKTGNAIEPLAEVQMALKAVFNPGKGFLKVRAALTSASFILSRNCHLTGGFAFYTWFKDNPEERASAGDFVLTLGGYHPRFKPPAYYPKVAPLGFNWQVSRELVVKGDFYFALVPSAVMAGGHLSATWTSGKLKAWFREGADFIISWKPYFYDAFMYLDMGVSYTYHFFGTHHISVDIGADLHIWGPEFSGKAHVHLWIVTFDVTFGAGSSQDPPELTWDEFRGGFLPENSKWANVSVTKGLVKQLGDKNDPLFIINPKDFMVETSSALPLTESTHSLDNSNTNIHIGSMKIMDKVKSRHNVSINKTGAGDVTSDFTFTPVKKHVPGALWGAKFKHSEHESEDERLVKNACMGFTITGKPVRPSGETHDVESEKLLNENEDFNGGTQIAFGTPATLGSLLKDSDVENTIEANADGRNELLQALGFQETFHPKKELAEEFIISTS